MKLFKVYVKNGEDLFTDYFRAENEKDVRKILSGQYGLNIAKVKDVSKELSIRTKKLIHKYATSDLDIIKVTIDSQGFNIVRELK